jgi:hypothetical protein
MDTMSTHHDDNIHYSISEYARPEEQRRDRLFKDGVSKRIRGMTVQLYDIALALPFGSTRIIPNCEVLDIHCHFGRGDFK